MAQENPQPILITGDADIPPGYLLQNVTTDASGNTYAYFVPEQSAADKLLANPLLYVIIIIALILVGIMKLMPKNKADPSTKPFWGIEVRAAMTNKILKQRLSMFGEKMGFKFFKGQGTLIGIVERKEPIYKRKIKNKFIPLSDDEIKEALKKKAKKKFNREPSEPEIQQQLVEIKQLIVNGDYQARKNYSKREKTTEEISFWLLAIRDKGFFGWLKWVLLKRSQKMLIDPEALTLYERKKEMYLDPNSWIHDHSGVWTLGTKKENILIDELNLQKDIENVKGYTADYLRRLSHESPSQSIFNERLSHEAELKEKAKQGRMTTVIGR